uniref:Uncharacterized protein n=1 Tax=Heterorhabditis bacteriophora TaxID=37862 RepID=A0A1I7WP39_HETBA
MRILLIVLLLPVILSVLCSDENSVRGKRSYYSGYDYGYGVDGDFWYAGRIFGIIIGILIFLVCCCTPCICLAGIWFLGWFGFNQSRRRNENKASSSVAAPSTTVFSTPPRTRHVVVDTSPRPYDPRSIEQRTGDQIIYAAEDRYYTSSAPSADHRPDAFRASKF